MFKKMVSGILTVVMVISMGISVMATSDSTKNYSMGEKNTYEQNPSVSLLAAEAGYISSLYMSSNSNHWGAYRDYTKNNFKCIINKAYDMAFDVNNGQIMPNNLDVLIWEKNWFDETELSRSSCSFTANNQSRTVVLGNCGSGSRAFSFHTPSFSGISSDKVELLSY